MAKKVDYIKVEQALRDGLHQIKVRNLLRYADLSTTLGMVGAKPKELSNAQKKEIVKSIVKNLEVDILTIKKRDPKLYEKMEFDKMDLKSCFANPSQIKGEQWERIKQVRMKVDEFKKELKKKINNASDEEIIKTQRKKQKTRRYNTNETWVPLH